MPFFVCLSGKNDSITACFPLEALIHLFSSSVTDHYVCFSEQLLICSHMFSRSVLDCAAERNS